MGPLDMVMRCRKLKLHTKFVYNFGKHGYKLTPRRGSCRAEKHEEHTKSRNGVIRTWQAPNVLGSLSIIKPYLTRYRERQ